MKFREGACVRYDQLLIRTVPTKEQMVEAENWKENICFYFQELFACHRFDELGNTGGRNRFHSFSLIMCSGAKNPTSDRQYGRVAIAPRAVRACLVLSRVRGFKAKFRITVMTRL